MSLCGWIPHSQHPPLLHRRGSNNKVGDEGAHAVSAGLTGLTLLEELYLQQNRLGGAGGLAVARAAARLTKLRTLHLWCSDDDSFASCDADEATKAAIRDMLPHVKDWQI